MPNRYTAVTVRPSDGGALMTRPSAEIPGMANYTIKRDFRRDLDQEIRREGHDYFRPNLEQPLGNQPFPNAPNTDEPITLIHLARRPNGQTAVIAGTPTKLFRFSALENGNYFASDYVQEEDAYTEEAAASGAWKVIGSGFSPNGQRWEAHNINGYTVLNNGVDLPMTFRVEESSVRPIYELREQGIAAVGTICEFNGILMCADISQIVEEKLVALLSNIESKSVTASQSGSIFSGLTTAAINQGTLNVTASNSTFNNGNGFVAGMVGKYLRLSNGFSRPIAAVTDATHVVLSGSPPIVDMLDLPFYIVDLAMSSADFVVTASDDFFTVDMVGQTILWKNPILLFTASAATDLFTANAHGLNEGDVVRVDANAGQILPVGLEPGIYYIRDVATNTFKLATTLNGDPVDMTADGEGYVARVDVSMGAARRIAEYISPTQVKVDSDISIPAGLFAVTNKDAYAAFTDQSQINRIQYRLLWSMPEQPRRFAAVVPGTIAAGSNVLTLKYPVKSLFNGQTILILGAGGLGGNLTATIQYIADGHTVVLDAFAGSSVVETIVQAFDSVGSIVGFSDLQDDSSGILRMLPLRGMLVIYKDTSIFLGSLRTATNDPFAFTKVYRGNKTLFYRNALIEVNGAFHIYPGRSSFYRFDLTTQTPEEIFEAASKVFYDHANLANTNFIFATDNSLTQEIFFCFPSESQDKAICFDYIKGTLSTTSAAYTAAATIKKPQAGILVGAVEEWFCMGTIDGSVLQYTPNQFHRIGQGYESVLQSGLISFGDDFNEKDVGGYVLHLASQSPDSPVLFQLFSTVNPANPAALIASQTIASPIVRNLVSMFKRDIYFQDKLVVSGMNNPFRISARTWNVAGVRSMSQPRRSYGISAQE